jgi:hypothetical protein
MTTEFDLVESVGFQCSGCALGRSMTLFRLTVNGRRRKYESGVPQASLPFRDTGSDSKITTDG